MGERYDLIFKEWPAEVVDAYREFARFTPIDDFNNFHVPIANLTALMSNVNRGQNQAPKPYSSFLLFKPPEPDVHIDDLLLQDDRW